MAYENLTPSQKDLLGREATNLVEIMSAAGLKEGHVTDTQGRHWLIEIRQFAPVERLVSEGTQK